MPAIKAAGSGQRPRIRPIRQDIQDLAQLAQKRDPEGRTELYARIVKLFEYDGRNLTDSERSLMCDILRYLVREVEMSVRASVAERLATNPDAPVDLILMLANDQIEVARSVLIFSTALSDANLVDIIQSKALQHQLCIASRRNLSSTVSSALVATGENSVVYALLTNPSSTIAPAAYREILARSGNDTSLQLPLIKRADLPKSLAEQLYQLVSEDLKALIREHFALSPSTLNHAVSDAIERLAAEDEGERLSAPSAERLIEKLHQGGQLSPAFLVKSLNQNQYELFEQAFARLLNLSLPVFRRVLHGRGIEGLAVSCRAVGIDRSVFLTVYRMTRLARGLSAELNDQETARSFSIFQNMDRRKAEITIHSWAADESRAPIF